MATMSADDDLLRERVQFATQLRQLRKKAKMTGEEVAKRSGMSQSKVSRLETGNMRPTITDVEILTRVLKVPQDLRKEMIAQAEVMPMDQGEDRLMRELKGRAKKQEMRLMEVGFELAGAAQSLIAESLLQRKTNSLTDTEMRVFKAVSEWQNACAESIEK